MKEAAKTKLLQIFDVGKHLYDSFCKKRFISKFTRISVTIHRYVMLTFITKSDGKLSQKKIAICKKAIDDAHRLIQMAQIRGYDMQKLSVMS